MLPAIVSGLLLLLYAGQLNLGRWQADEYHYFTDQRFHGLRALFDRLPVSPRPFSEVLIYLYGEVVLSAHRPLVGVVLALLWAAVTTSMIVAAWSCLLPTRLRLAGAVSLGVAPIVFVLANNAVTEIFFWPVASLAYLPTVASASVLLFLLDDGATRLRRLCCSMALVTAATSHEIGAALAVGFALAMALNVIGRPPAAGGRARLVGCWWWILPGLIGLGVMAVLVVFRFGINDLGAQSKPYTGHFLASGLAAAQHLALDLVTTGRPGDRPVDIAATLLTRGLFAIGFALVWTRLGRVEVGVWRTALAAGLCLAAFFSLFAAYFHYGTLCCERQATTRHWLIDLLWILAATSAIRRLQARQQRPYRLKLRWLGSCLLTLSLTPAVFEAPAIGEDYHYISLAIAARSRTWASGRNTATDHMVFYLPPDTTGMLVHGTSEQLTTRETTDTNLDLSNEVGRFFDKSVVTTCEPWQTGKSWLYDGEFIPACPPHAGPPDIVFNSH